jgi:glycosyltransferase involved in cell wall biosynthesis
MSYLIEACAILRQKGIPALCKIVGDGEERQTLMSLIEKYDLQGTVELVGAKKQEEVASLLQTADCYAQPSVITPSGKMEGIPVALMEALSSQLPVVASDISGISELVRPNETGYLVPPADPNALASTLEHIYTHPEEARVLGETGRQVVQMEFEIHKNVSELAELFSKKLFLKN